MSSHIRLRLWAAAAAAALLAAPSAGALPNADSVAGSVSFRASRPGVQPLPAQVPPANDAFSAAEPVAGLPFAASQGTLEATTAPDDPLCSGNAASVWYAYTPAVTVWLTADTFGSDYDTTLSAHTGTQGALAQVACNGNAEGGLQSQITFLAQGGTTYYLMAAGVSGGGALQLSLDVRLPLVPIGVRTTQAYEGYPAAGSDAIAWAQWPRRNGKFWTALVQRTGEPRVRVNRQRTDGYPGGIDGDTFVFQEARRPRSSIVFHDVATGARSAPPPGVNTRQWEWGPSISGDWLLFGRQLPAQKRDQIILRNLATGESILLDQISWRGRRGATPGQVSGNYAVWHRCTSLCNVFLYDIAAGTRTRLTGQAGRHHYYPAVTDDGTVYYVRSGRGCGASVRIVRHRLGGSPVVLTSFPARWEAARTSAVENADGSATLLYDRFHCKQAPWDVFKVVDP
ncbi:MAG TPA: hypothetical protein VD769_02485 [Gaiellaceae bacterium]|nr:hypothetical protein [Gaiellaceae bacterium]